MSTQPTANMTHIATLCIHPSRHANKSHPTYSVLFMSKNTKLRVEQRVLRCIADLQQIAASKSVTICGNSKDGTRMWAITADFLSYHFPPVLEYWFSIRPTPANRIYCNRYNITLLPTQAMCSALRSCRDVLLNCKSEL